MTATTKEEPEEDDAAKAKEDEREQEDKYGIGSFFSIKRNNSFMCMSTEQLKFLDMSNCIAPGFSYDKYMNGYGCKVTKGHFP